MASKFYIKTFDSVIYELSATTDINVAITSKASSNPVENGQTLTDNIVVGNDTLSMSGRLTDIIQRGDSRAKTPFEFITELETRIGFKEVFTVYYSDSLIPKINCSIDSFS